MVQSKSILIVDDDTNILSVLAECLKRDGWAVHAAESWSKALETWSSLNPKPVVVLIDLNIHSCDDGLALARGFAADSPQTKVVICSGNFTEKADYPPQFYYMDKPFDLADLRLLLNTMMDVTNKEIFPS